MSNVLHPRMIGHPWWWMFVTKTSPENGEVDVPWAAKIVITFDKDIDPAEEGKKNFELDDEDKKALHISKHEPIEMEEVNPDQIIGIWFDGILDPASVKELDAIIVTDSPKTPKED